MDYIGTAPVTELRMQRPCDAYGVVAKIGSRNPIVLPFLVSIGSIVPQCPTTIIQRDYLKGNMCSVVIDSFVLVVQTTDADVQL